MGALKGERVGAGVRSRTSESRIAQALLTRREGVRADGAAADETLIALMARGDETALAELYDRFERVAYALALRIVRDRGLAEDAVQEAFVTVWRSAGTFVAERAKARTWVLTLVHRRAVDLVRREEPRRFESTDALSYVEQDDHAAVDDAVWSRLERERVQGALRALPEAQRHAIELAYYGGFSQSEVADRLGVPLGTIKSRMFTGLAHLRELLAEPATDPRVVESARPSTS